MKSPSLVRIDRVLDEVGALIAATEEKPAEQSIRRYLDAYLVLANDHQTIEAVEVDLKDMGYPGVAADRGMTEIVELDAMVCGTTMRVGEIDLYDGQDDSPYSVAFRQLPKRSWVDVRPELLRWLCRLREALLKARAFVQERRGRKRARRPAKPRKPRPLTVPQTEAVQIVGECKGNIAQAAKRLGKDRKTVSQAYRAGLAKLGKQPVKVGTRTFPRDRRGQVDLAEGDDRRG